MSTAKARSGRKRNHPVHEYFSYNQENKESQCLIGSCTYKMPGDHAGNKTAHLQSMHKEHFKTMETEHHARQTAQGNAKRQKTAVRPGLLNGVKMTGPALQLNCLRLVSQHRLAFQMLDYEAFQAIVEPYTNAMPANERVVISSRTIPAMIPGCATEVRQMIAEEVKGKMLSLMVDGCSRGFRHFIGASIQFIEGKDVHMRVLAVEELLVASTASNLKAVISQILSKYSISVKQIVAYTSDNGGNYLLACKMLEEEAKQVRQAEYEEDEYDDYAEDLRQEWPQCELLEGDFSIQSVRCAAHTLQLATEDAVKATPSFKALTQQVREYAKFLRSPTLTRELRDRGLSLPKLDVSTRWGSSYDMLDSVLKLRDFADTRPQEEQVNNGLAEEDWEAIGEYVQALKPARLATIALQRKDLLLGDFYHIWSKCKLKLQKLGSELSNNLLNSMEERAKSQKYKGKNRDRGEKLSSLFGYTSFNAAIFLDPRYMSLLTDEERLHAKSYLVSLWSRLEKIKSGDGNTGDSDSGDEPSTLTIGSDEGDSDCSDDEFEKFLASKNKAKRTLRTGVASSKRNIIPLLDAYFQNTEPLKTKENVLEWWEKRRLIDVELNELAKIVLAIPATQVSIERLFSALRFVLNPQRFGLSAANVDDILILHTNADLLKVLAEQRLLKEKPNSASTESSPPVPDTSETPSASSSCSAISFSSS